jgi:hypothetical protein
MKYTLTFNNNGCDLAYYLSQVLFTQWEEDRKPLELKWQQNLDAFNSVSNGIWKAEEGEEWRSDTFIGVTKQKIIAAWSLCVDVVLQGNKLPFGLSPSPWSGVVLDAMNDQERKAIESIIEDHKDLILQQMKDCKADRQLMKEFLSAAIYGEGWAKRFVHQVDRTMYQTVQGMNGRMEPVIKSHLSPAWRYVPVWNIFRDPETNDIQNSQGIAERDFISLYALRQKMGKPYYLDDAIETAISEADKHYEGVAPNRQGEDKSALSPILRSVKHPRLGVRNIEFWCRVPRGIVEEFEKDLQSGGKGIYEGDVNNRTTDGDEVEVLVEMANDQIIRFLRIEEDETRPFYRVVWEDKLDHIEATGIADNLESTQIVINGMVRSFEDNLKLAGNVILAIKEDLIQQWDKTIKPGLKLVLADECEDARQAVQQIIVQSVGAVILEGLALFERYADEASLLPKILQGAQQEKQKADTAFEMNLLQANSGKYMGGVIRNFDEGLIEPVVEDFYHFNMMDPDSGVQPADLTVEALGFTSFQDQVVRLQKLMQFINLILSAEPLSGEAKFRELLEACGKSLDLDPDQFLKSAAERKQEQDAQSRQADEQYKLTVANLVATVDKLKAEAQAEIEKIRLEGEKVKLERFKVVEEIKLKEKQSMEANKTNKNVANKPVEKKKKAGKK